MNSPSTSFGLNISIGTTRAIAAIIGFAVLVPSVHGLVNFTENLMKIPGPSPPEVQETTNKIRLGARVGLAVLVFMIAAVNL
jgi:hypothetical protein